MKIWVCLLLILLISHSVISQNCPLPSFTVNTGLCIQEDANLSNSTVIGEAYEWDFCSGELLDIPTTQLSALDAALNAPYHIEIEKDAENYYGFVPSRNNRRLYRVDYGTSLTNTNPDITDLGNFDNTLGQVLQIKVLK